MDTHIELPVDDEELGTRVVMNQLFSSHPIPAGRHMGNSLLGALRFLHLTLGTYLLHSSSLYSHLVEIARHDNVLLES
jgi:hypothetical protein